MDWTTLTVQTEAAVATVTLNRPAARNAFNEDSIGELTEVFLQLGADPALRAIVLAANGPAFCAGADLHWMRRMAAFSDADNEADALRLAHMLRTIYLCPQPVVARVQGDCYGGGMGLAAACDIIVASGDAAFCLSEVRLGLIPATIAPYVIRAMGENAARRYCLTAERFGAHEAHRLGLVHEVVSSDTLDAAVARITAALAGNGPQAVRQSKILVREVAERPLDDALLADTAARIATIRASEQGREGVLAFLEKRQPGWRDAD